MRDDDRKWLDGLPFSENEDFWFWFSARENVNKRFVRIRDIFAEQSQQIEEIAKFTQQAQKAWQTWQAEPTPASSEEDQDLAVLRDEIAALRKENASLKATQQQEAQKRDKERDEMRSAIKMLYDHQEKWSGAVQSLQAENERLQRELAASRTAEAALRSDVEAIKSQLRMMQQPSQPCVPWQVQPQPPQTPQTKPPQPESPKPPRPTPPQPEPPKPPRPPQPEPPSPFELPHEKRMLFSDSSAHNHEALARVRDLALIESYLDEHPMEDTHILQVMLQQYVKALKKELDGFDKDDFDPEEWAQELSDTVWNAIEPQFIVKIMTTIARGLRIPEKAAFYRGMLQVANAYLSQLYIYTEPVHEGDVFAQQDIEPNVIDAPDAAHAGRIQSINRLPYYLDYIDDSGEVQRKTADGSAIVWRKA